VLSLDLDGLAVESSGDGAAVVLVHAGVADGRMWDPQWAAWRSSYRLVRLDLRGHGRSAPATGSFAHARDLLRVLDALGIRQAVLVGASFGGLVALDLAVSHRNRVSGLVLACVPLPDHHWSAELEAFDLAESRALAARDLDTAVALNLDLWLPGAPATVRSAIAEQQRRAFELQIDAGGKHQLLAADLASRVR
jgi:pimeloyl-ACP methyl ester carboxylesterase